MWKEDKGTVAIRDTAYEPRAILTTRVVMMVKIAFTIRMKFKIERKTRFPLVFRSIYTTFAKESN